MEYTLGLELTDNQGHSLRSIGRALCANITETPAPLLFTVEGQEVFHVKEREPSNDSAGLRP